MGGLMELWRLTDQSHGEPDKHSSLLRVTVLLILICRYCSSCWAEAAKRMWEMGIVLLCYVWTAILHNLC